jgi:hypothetical protein
VLGINAFDQPNVQESKDNTNRLLKEVSDKGGLPQASPSVTDGELSLYMEDSQNFGDFINVLKQLLSGRINAGDYIAILAYLTENSATDAVLDHVRLALQSKFKVATTMGYGPRYLHSTGQLHKGGPNKGIFLQLTADVGADINVPGKPYSFGVLKKAQAQGDLEALHKHGRRAFRIHLGRDQGTGLVQFREAIETAMSGGK